MNSQRELIWNVPTGFVLFRRVYFSFIYLEIIGRTWKTLCIRVY